MITNLVAITERGASLFWTGGGQKLLSPNLFLFAPPLLETPTIFSDGGTERRKEREIGLVLTLLCMGDKKERPWKSLTLLAFSYNILIEGIQILYRNTYIIMTYPANNYVNDWQKYKKVKAGKGHFSGQAFKVGRYFTKYCCQNWAWPKLKPYSWDDPKARQSS